MKHDNNTVLYIISAKIFLFFIASVGWQKDSSLIESNNICRFLKPAGANARHATLPIWICCLVSITIYWQCIYIAGTCRALVPAGCKNHADYKGAMIFLPTK